MACQVSRADGGRVQAYQGSSTRAWKLSRRLMEVMEGITEKHILNFSFLTEILRPGMKAELLSDENPTEGWGVTVTENTGGFLGLSFDSPELKVSCNHLRLFCTSPRLLLCGSIASGTRLSFKAPACLRAKNYPDKVLNSF